MSAGPHTYITFIVIGSSDGCYTVPPLSARPIIRAPDAYCSSFPSLLVLSGNSVRARGNVVFSSTFLEHFLITPTLLTLSGSSVHFNCLVPPPRTSVHHMTNIVLSAGFLHHTVAQTPSRPVTGGTPPCYSHSRPVRSPVHRADPQIRSPPRHPAVRSHSEERRRA